MSAGLARNWGAVGLRGVAGIVFGLGVLALPPPTVASLVLLFAAYVVADGILAILAGTWEAGRGQRWWMLIVEGLTNLTAAGASSSGRRSPWCRWSAWRAPGRWPAER